LYKEAQDQAKEAAEAHNKGLNTFNAKDKEMEKVLIFNFFIQNKINFYENEKYKK